MSYCVGYENVDPPSLREILTNEVACLQKRIMGTGLSNFSP